VDSGAFYAQVFGWRIPDWEAYNTFGIRSESGSLIGGMVGLPEDASTDQQAMWLISIETENLDEVLTRVVAENGSVVHGPSAVFGGMRTAVVQDPQGAVFQLVEGAVDRPDCWIWFELAAEEPSVSAAWYQKVFGIETRPDASGERILLSREGEAFGSVSTTVFENAKDQWVPVLAVSQLSSLLENVVAAQGEVLLKTERVALILDAQGAPLLLQEQEVTL
jgi:predicted enzyme related to lactoylglutathione lyase